jgi:hypothetical protein
VRRTRQTGAPFSLNSGPSRERHEAIEQYHASVETMARNSQLASDVSLGSWFA